MFLALSLLSFVVGFYLALCWSKRKYGGASSLDLPHGVSVVIDYLRKASLPSDGIDHDEKSASKARSGASSDCLLTKDEVEAKFDASSWQRLAYDDFRTTLLARGTGRKTFPCIYATMGYRANDHRYLFIGSDNPSEPRNIRLIGPALESYLHQARSFGPNTSLVIMGAPSENAKTVDEYNNHFWDMLRGLRIYDRQSWPHDVPSKTESEKWTFCYNGEPVFPVMLTPAHTRRYSRHMSVPVIALQPKWVLDQLLGTPEKRDSATSKVRKLLKEYDTIDISPDLTTYGQPGTSESRQLCLSDENASVECPYEDFDR